MSVQGVDYSFGRPGGAALKAAGKAFAVRYVPYPGDGGKGLEAAERDDLHGNGIAIALVFESTAGRMLEGYEAGVADARQVAKSAIALLVPGDRPYYFACDIDVTGGMEGYIDNYLDGAAAVLGRDRTGVYGEYDEVKHCLETGSARWGWQAYAWSYGKLYSGAHLYQYRNGQIINGAEVDFCEALKDDYGQWRPPEEEDMGMIQDMQLAMFAGSEQPGDRATRLAYAQARIAAIASGIAASLVETGADYPVASALPSGTELTVKVV